MTIIITNDSNKKMILKKLSKEKKICNIKFYSFKELKKKLFFDYNDLTLEYIIKKYKVSLDIAKVYLDNMYFLDVVKSDKVKFLIKLNEELDKEGLLLKDKDFKSYLRNKKIIVYGYSSLSKEEELILNEIDWGVEYQKREVKKYKPRVYEAKSEKEEVLFVINKISVLLSSGVDINKIKVIARSDYNNSLNRYFRVFNIPLNLEESNSYLSTLIASDFLEFYEEYSLEENIDRLSEKYEDLNDLITIINKSVLIKDKGLRKEFIIRDLKATNVRVSKYDKAVDIVNTDYEFSDDEYVFWLGFNVNCYPCIYKDDDYLSDSIKEQLGIDTSTLKNSFEKEKIKDKASSIKNLVITYKLSNYKSVFYPSLLISEMDLEVEQIVLDNSISYSLLNSNLLYACDLDNLYKFNIVSDDLGLYKNSLNIKYREYNNEFTGIDKEALKARIGGELKLAYTNMEMYNECAFKYYLSKVLKIDVFEESFKTIIGNVVHHVLEIGLTKEIDIDVEIIKFIKEKDYPLNKREYFYLEKLSKELKEILIVLKEQEAHTSLNNYLFESEISIYKDKEDFNITFSGLIDKVMYKDIDGKRTIAVVDYKTGSTFVTLDNLEYGLNIQLPIYLYLLKKSEQFKDATIAGFYIQKVLDNVPLISDKLSLDAIRRDNLRLQGYSNSSTDILEMLDDNYQESKIVKGLRFKKDGSFYSTAKVLTNEEMEDITKVVEEKIDKCIDNIIDGEFNINPKVIKGKNIACLYCKFKDICFMEHKNEVVLGGEVNEVDGRTVGCDN